MSCKHKWAVAKTIWPFPDGWGTYCKKCRMILDTGLEKEDADRIAQQMNDEASV